MSEADLQDIDPTCVVELDVRALLAARIEPLATILAAVGELPDGHALHLRSPFEPVPLFQMLSQRGFAHRSAAFGPDDWSTWIWRADVPPRRTAAPVAPEAPLPPDILDLRRLAPPEPLLRLLARLEASRAPFRVALPMLPDLLQELVRDANWTIDGIETLHDGGVVVALIPPAPAPASRDRLSAPRGRTPDRSTD
ncbi:MAG: DUF2249 domain-containing protein [Gemmatimonadetes bacterium]|nr:DUF2249 domain-containing protein [Gemmatimonadota bacterium]MCA9762732.1 DUF2249 domain-containing protein [Gemmatimonadota bacterium]MCB9505009.1 DUF2249 domain-containing protein [Gemmatimonadales bacterium]HPF62288.1 DUF2249 domain-containing protein [Gemmatimonadales bacterium]HRX17586.1 DUF2249 domain-containing protein [Gemmatimonadales bacterium]